MSEIKSALESLGSSTMAQLQLEQQSARLRRLKEQGEKVSAAASVTPEMDKAAQQFEGLLLKEMLKSMWQTVPSEGMLSSSKEESMYRDMLNDAYAEDLSSGQGIGIKELIIKEFQRR